MKTLSGFEYFIGAVMVFCLFAIWSYESSENDHAAKMKAEMPQCEYLGINRDLPMVDFFDCDGVVTMRMRKK